MAKTPEQEAKDIAARINKTYKVGDEVGSGYFGWAGTPWRPGDAGVAFKRCWVEDAVLYLETSAPYEDMKTSLLLSVHKPSGLTIQKGRLTIQRAEKVVLGKEVGLPEEGCAFEAY